MFLSLTLLYQPIVHCAKVYQYLVSKEHKLTKTIQSTNRKQVYQHNYNLQKIYKNVQKQHTFSSDQKVPVGFSGPGVWWFSLKYSSALAPVFGEFSTI